MQTSLIGANTLQYEGKKAEPAEEATEQTDAEKPVLEAQLYSSRVMDMAILNSLGVSSHPPDEAPSAPVIGMDGKTEDGAVPYQILTAYINSYVIFLKQCVNRLFFLPVD